MPSPSITEFDEAVTSAGYLAYAEKAVEEQEADASNCWMSAIDVSSRNTYYYHIDTRETSWSMPIGYNGSVGSHSSTSRIQEHHKDGAFSEERNDSIESRASVDADALISRKKRNQDWVSPTKQRQQYHPATQAQDEVHKTPSRRLRFSLYRNKKENTSPIDSASPDLTVDTSLSLESSSDDCCDGVTRFSC